MRNEVQSATHNRILSFSYQAMARIFGVGIAAVDIINVTVAPESGGMIGSESISYLLPTIGFRGIL